MVKPSASRRLFAAVLALALLSVLSGCGSKKASTETAAPPPAPSPAPPAVTEPAPEPPKPAPAPPKLPGAVGVMIENHPDARPQAGLEKADVVYETEAEGGITRFLALFYHENPAKIGPVRSARMGFYDIATAYGVPYVHVGGNNDVLLEIKNRNQRLLDIDDMHGGPFYRTTDRKMPHNDYTSSDGIIKWANAKGWKWKPLPAFDEGKLADGGTDITSISMNWGPKANRVQWDWNGKRYQRSDDGQPHLAESGARIEADNLVVLFTKFVWDQSAQWGEGQNNIRITGSGEGYLYRDGKGFVIKWTKNSRDALYQFSTLSGAPLAFGPGQTWIEILKSRDGLTQGAIE